MARALETSRAKLTAALAVGIVVGVATTFFGATILAPLIGWDAAAVFYLTWVWRTILRMDAPATEAHAVREDPGRTTSHVLLIVASVASLGAVAAVIASADSYASQVAGAAVALASIGLSWALVHTLYTTRYARLFYVADRGVDFNEKTRPHYGDFAYLAFTIGMTYQVSDTNLTTTTMRAVALRHALISFGFGAVILAATINLLSGLAL